MWQLTETMLRDLGRWAESKQGVEELWLFGSHARGDAGPYSDVDFAIALAPVGSGGDHALSTYFENAAGWQRELWKIVGTEVSLEAIRPNTPADRRIRGEGRLLWKRAGKAGQDAGPDAA